MSGGRRREEPTSHPHSQPHHLVANGGGGGGGGSVLRGSLWGKALRSDASWEDKDEFLDVIYWFRQIIAVILGVIWGIVPLKGFVGIAIFCLINAGVLYLYFSSFQQIDEEEYGGTWELTKEGFMTSFALFLVLAILLRGSGKMGDIQSTNTALPFLERAPVDEFVTVDTIYPEPMDRVISNSKAAILTTLSWELSG